MHAFVSLPVGAMFNPVFETCAKVVMLRGIETIRAKPVQAPAAQEIRHSRFVIADLTGGHPNALQEARYASQLGKPCIFISQESPEKAALHVDGLPVHQYDPADLESLHDVLRQLVGALLNGDATFARIGMMNIGPQRWANPFANGSMSC